jgi:hypothetical protein
MARLPSLPLLLGHLVLIVVAYLIAKVSGELFPDWSLLARICFGLGTTFGACYFGLGLNLVLNYGALDSAFWTQSRDRKLLDGLNQKLQSEGRRIVYITNHLYLAQRRFELLDANGRALRRRMNWEDVTQMAAKSISAG